MSVKVESQKANAAAIDGVEAPSGTDIFDVNEIKPKPEVDIGYEANILDDYDSSTYHFRLFMMDPDGIKGRSFDPQGQAKRILIAESGATTIGIDDVSITTFPAPSSRYRMGTATNIRFTLSQPLGADLVDKIFAGSKRLGIQNFGKVPFFLELSFRGKEPDRTLGGTMFPGALQEALLGEDSLSSVVWVWPIKLLTMNMTVDSGGSMYTITAVANSDMAYSNEAADLEKKATLPASTVEELITELEKVLNGKEEDKTEESKTQTKRDKYTFYIDSDIANSKIVRDFETRIGEFNKEVPEKAELVYEPGTSIDKIIEDVLSNSVYFQRKARGVKDENQPTAVASEKTASEQTIYQLITDTQLGEYDEKRNDYSRHYRYLIVPYKMTTINTRANKQAEVSSQQRYNNIRRLGRLRKAYNYIYTGLNDQVFDFDVSLNFSWYAVDQFLSGKDVNPRYEPTGAEAEVDDKGIDNKDKTDPKSLSENLGLDPDSFPGEVVDDFSDFVGSENFSESLVEGILTGDFDQLTGQTSEFLASQVSSGVRLAGTKLFPSFVKDSFQEREQLLEEEKVDEKAINPYSATESYIETAPGKQNDISGGDIKNPGKILLAQFFEQAAGPPSADLLNVSLRVKGDPFWLSPGPIGRNSQFKTLFDEALSKYNVAVNHNDPDAGIVTVSPDSKVDISSVDATGGQVYFLFRLFTPLESTRETGIVEGIGENNAINGVFAARVIEHNFSGGQFTQTIDGWRDTRIAVKDLDLGLGVADDRGLWEDWFSQGATATSVDEGTALSDAILRRQNGNLPSDTQGGANVDDVGIDNGPRYPRNPDGSIGA